MKQEPRVRFPNKLPTIEELVDLLVDEALKRTGNNQAQAARLLGITRQAVQKRMRNRKEHPGS